MWFDEAVVYQIYPLGLCGVLNEERSSDDSVVGHSILEVKDWISHIKKLGATCVLFNPLMESDYHGYDTRDYYTLDRRLGTNDDLKEVCDAIHEAGLKILFDGVFNHVGRGFWAFKDVQEKKWEDVYKRQEYHESAKYKTLRFHVIQYYWKYSDVYKRQNWCCLTSGLSRFNLTSSLCPSHPSYQNPSLYSVFPSKLK